MNKQQIERERKQVLIDKAIAILEANGQEITPVSMSKITGIPRATIIRMTDTTNPMVAGLDTDMTTYGRTIGSQEGVLISETEVLLGENGLDISKGFMMPEQVLSLMTELLGSDIAKDLLLTPVKANTLSTLSGHLLSCLKDVCHRDSIYSQSKHFHYLDSQGWRKLFQLLFERYHRYINGKHCFKYKLTSLGEGYIKSMCLVIGQLDMVSATPTGSDYLLPRDCLGDIRPRDMFNLLSKCRGITPEFFVIDNGILDVQFSRKYSVITSIGSDTRDTNYIGYDISACLQSIVIQSLDSDFPQHIDYLTNKLVIRTSLMEELDLTKSMVKQVISAMDNGKEYPKLCAQSEWLTIYQSESAQMASEYNDYMKHEFPEMYARSYEMANSDKFGVKKPYSILFFNWTQVEREIRESMISFAKDSASVEFVHECHDAIYIDNKYDRLDIPALEQHIKATTGFDITID